MVDDLHDDHKERWDDSQLLRRSGFDGVAEQLVHCAVGADGVGGAVFDELALTILRVYVQFTLVQVIHAPNQPEERGDINFHKALGVG